MTEVDALFEIAAQINNLFGAVAGVAFVLWMFLIFKNMGGGDCNCNEKEEQEEQDE